MNFLHISKEALSIALAYVGAPIADDLEDWFDRCFTWNTEILAWGADLEPRMEGSHNIMYAQYYGWKKVMTDGEDRRQP